MEHSTPSELYSGVCRTHGLIDCYSRREKQGYLYHSTEVENKTLWDGGAISSFCEVLESSLLAHGGDCEPKEHGSESHDTVDAPSLRVPLPLDIEGSDKETNKDT